MRSDLRRDRSGAEEAIVNALVDNQTMTGRDRAIRVDALPRDRLRIALK